MGAIQNSVNGILGAVAGATTLGMHIANQAEQTAETKALKEQQATQFQKEQDLQKAELEQTIANNEATLGEQDNYVESELQRLPDYNDDIANMSTDDKLKLLESNAGGAVLNARKGIELERARAAMETVQGKMEARRQLKFDIDVARKKLEMIGGNK